jgi:hypothetical protein
MRASRHPSFSSFCSTSTEGVSTDATGDSIWPVFPPSQRTPLPLTVGSPVYPDVHRGSYPQPASYWYNPRATLGHRRGHGGGHGQEFRGVPHSPQYLRPSTGAKQWGAHAHARDRDRDDC